MIAKDICWLVAQVQTILGQPRAGKVRLLGVTTKARVGILPDIPTLAEAGLPGFESVTWYGFFGPKGLDPAIGRACECGGPSWRSRTRAEGEDGWRRQHDPHRETVDQFRATVKSDRAKWAEIVKRSGASID